MGIPKTHNQKALIVPRTHCFRWGRSPKGVYSIVSPGNSRHCYRSFGLSLVFCLIRLCPVVRTGLFEVGLNVDRGAAAKRLKKYRANSILRMVVQTLCPPYFIAHSTKRRNVSRAAAKMNSFAFLLCAGFETFAFFSYNQYWQKFTKRHFRWSYFPGRERNSMEHKNSSQHNNTLRSNCNLRDCQLCYMHIWALLILQTREETRSRA